MQRPKRETATWVELPCACANLRRAVRAVTQLYEGELRPTGLRATQFTLLQVLAAVGGITQGRLGELLSMDSTTLSRTLRPLWKRGWIRSFPGQDRRERHWQLTLAGRRQLQQSRKCWQRAQERLRGKLGDSGWRGLQAALREVTRAAAVG